MCGRFVQIDATITRLAAIKDFKVETDTYSPNRRRLEGYNIAPQSTVVVIRKNADGKTALDTMFWGIEPPWERNSSRFIINARSEGIAEKPAFKNLLGQKIVVPVDGFYEWTSGSHDAGQNRLKKTPFYFRRADGLPLLIAGIFKRTADAETGEIIERFVLITCSANSMMREYHDRMPAILETSQVKSWLVDDISSEQINHLSTPPANEVLIAHRVDAKVNSPRSEGPDLIREFAPSMPHNGQLFH